MISGRLGSWSGSNPPHRVAVARRQRPVATLSTQAWASHRYGLSRCSLHQRRVREASLFFRKGRQAAHATHLVDCEDATANQDLLNLCLLQFVGRVYISEDEFQVIPTQALA